MESIEKIVPNAFLLYGEGFCSNIYILTHGKEALLIDSGSGDTIPQLDLALESFNVRKVLLTHGHADHVTGMNYITADGLLHEKDLKILRELNVFIPDYKPPNNIDPLKAAFVEFGSFKLKAIPTPGHTPGSVSFYDEKHKLLFSGDTLFAGGGVGRTDLPGGNQAELEKSLATLKKIKRSRLCPGHGPLE